MAPAADLPGQCACSIYARLVVLRLGLPRGRLHVSACRLVAALRSKVVATADLLSCKLPGVFSSTLADLTCLP